MIYQISFNNMKEKIKLPVNPPDLSVSGGGTSFTDNTVIKGGERTVIGDTQLKVVSFSSFFPRDYDATYCSYAKIPKPWDAVKKIEKWRKSGKPVKLLITGTNINMYCTIRKFDYKEKGGEPGDVYFDLEFKEFKFIKIREIVQDNSKALGKTTSTSGRPNTQSSQKTYTVVSGDSLWKIATKFYGNGGRYTEIFNANSPPIKNASLIYPGQTFVIP